MYYPYFRGKQYELIAIRENVQRMGSSIVPIIEPVKRSTSGLRRALESLRESGCHFVVVANPRCGDFKNDPVPLHKELAVIGVSDYANCALGCIADASTSPEDIETVASLHPNVSVIHAGFHSAATLSAHLAAVLGGSQHIFLDGQTSRLYRRHFQEQPRILIRDGFVSRTNREHPDVEHFSDLHVTYDELSMNGFGDYLTVGDDYTETGGPAYAVAIHLTYVDPNEDNDMFVKHYVSDRQMSPVDPGGKFLEALQKLVHDADRENSSIFQSDAVQEFRGLLQREHYPGLGYVKKLSMQHHIELMANFLEQGS